MSLSGGGWLSDGECRRSRYSCMVPIGLRQEERELAKRMRDSTEGKKLGEESQNCKENE